MRHRTRAQVILIAGLLGASISGCATTPGGISVKSVQDAAVLACSYLPSVTTVSAIISANNPIVTTAEDIALAICALVKPSATARVKASAAHVYIPPGLAITGSFVH